MTRIKVFSKKETGEKRKFLGKAREKFGGGGGTKGRAKSRTFVGSGKWVTSENLRKRGGTSQVGIKHK